MPRECVGVFTVVMALVLIGTVVVFSASAVTSEALGEGDAMAVLLRQLECVALGLVGFLFAVRFDYHRLSEPRVYRAIALTSLFFLALVLVPWIGTEAGGARRWIRILGFSFQPSELAKMALIILLAVKLSANQGEIKSFFRGFLPAMALTVVFAGLVLQEGDLGVPVVMMAVAFLMIFMAGTRWIYVIASVLTGVGGVAAIAVATPYRMRRLLAFVDPWEHAQGTGYQLIHSLTAFARGGLLGQGAGASQQKLFYLPAAHTDFIFAVWGEEMGLAGTLLVVTLYALFLVFALRLALGAPDLLGTLLVSGIAAMISIHAAFNMGVATGLLPTKGLPLPFISSGGSALIVNLTMVGILLNVGLQAEEPAPHRKLAAAR